MSDGPTASSGAVEAPPDDALIGYLRAELANLQARLDRADSKAAGVLTAAFSAGGLAGATIAALKRPVGPEGITCGAIGVILLVIAIFTAIQVRDDAEKHDWLGIFFNEWLRIFRKSIRRLLHRRQRFKATACFSSTDPGFVREVIAGNLAIRIEAGGQLARWNEKAAQSAMLVLFGAVVFLGAAAIITILH